jgi:eukaryotic-like serine/threonine-protein kinase
VANLYEGDRRYTDAESLLRTAVEDLRKSPGPGRPVTIGALESLGTVLIQLRKYADAERALLEAIKARHALAPDSWEGFDNQSLLGASLAGQRRFEEAERLLVAGYEGLKQRADSIPAYNREVLGDSAQRLVDLYTAWGKPAQAAEWRRRAAE